MQSQSIGRGAASMTLVATLTAMTAIAVFAQRQSEPEQRAQTETGGAATSGSNAPDRTTAADELEASRVDDMPTASPAERAIAVAREAISKAPKSFEAHNALGMALARRARETADPAFYDRSDAALQRSLELEADNFPARLLGVWNQLGRHEFAAALVAAKALNERAKDDLLVYGMLVDANVELGNYADAEQAAQWMLNLRPGTPAAMTRVSYLRELFGDIEGACQAMTMAFHSTRPTEFEDRAWMLTHLAHLELERGKTEAGLAQARAALALFPDYHYALASLGAAHSLRGEWQEAVAAYQRRYEVAPHPENLYDLAVAVEAAGDADRATSMYTAFEAAALEESENQDNANLQLAEYWLDHTQDAEKWARALAQLEARGAVRQDVGTLELLGWARYRTGDVEAAQAELQRAVAVGSVNARLRRRAGEVAAAAGDLDAARVSMELAYRQSPTSDGGRAARRWLMAHPGPNE
ncbi:MAG: tetratricopeptide repeat protein [Planctomycetota bacterium]